MLNSELLDALPEILVSRIEGANEYMLKKAGEHINKLGRLTTSDIHRLDELRRASADIREIKRELSKVTKQNVSDIQQLFDWVAAQNYEESRAFYDWRGLNYIPYEQNEALQRMVQSMSQRTAESYVNLSQTTAVNVLKNGNTFPEPLEKGYADVIDQAVTNASMGVQDYRSAIRDTLRTFASDGLSVVYQSGVTRRMDTAARMNILEGIRQVNQGVQDQIGKEIGADGVEISAHGFCSPDHEDIQGKQLSDAEYAKWTEQHAYPRRKIGVLNCHHFAFRIILGVNEPSYSAEELAEMKRKNAEGVTFEGKHYTMYEATQVQRELETRVRREKDKQILAKASGDDDLRREAQGKINLLASKYKKFSDAAGLSYKSERLSVANFRRVKTKSELTNGNEFGKSSIKSTKSANNVNKVDFDYIKSDKYKQKFDGITDNKQVNSSLRECAKQILTHRSSSDYEDMCWVDSRNGNIVLRQVSSKNPLEVKYDNEITNKLKNYKPFSLISIHNHPTNFPPTGSDLVANGSRKYMLGVVVGHDGSVFSYKVGNKPFLAMSFDKRVDKYVHPPYNMLEREAYIKSLNDFQQEFGITWKEH